MDNIEKELMDGMNDEVRVVRNERRENFDPRLKYPEQRSGRNYMRTVSW